jgi:hypothetical protein
MKFVSLVNKILITILPVAVLSHLVWTFLLLVNHVEQRTMYLIGDGVIALWVIVSVFRLSAQYISTNPLEDVAEQTSVVVSTYPVLEQRAESYRWIKLSLGIAVLIGTIGLLYSVRIQYTGPLYDGTEIQQVVQQHIKGPMFSDEWVLAGYVQETVNRRSIPTFNIFENAPPNIYNFLTPLISALAGFMITTGLDIFSYYWVYIFIFQLFFIYVFFTFLRNCKISGLGSVVGVLLLAFLPESSLAPGIWIMLPAYVGLSFIFLAHAAMQEYRHTYAHRYKVYMWLHIILACLCYPPYLLLSIVYTICLGFARVKLKFVPTLFSFLGGVALIGIVLYSAGVEIQIASIQNTLRALWYPLVHSRFGVSTGAIWHYIPYVFFVTAAGGIYAWFRSARIDREMKYMTGIVLFVGISLLTATYYGNVEIVLSHQRTVFLCWLFMIVMTVYFLDTVLNTFFKNKINFGFQCGILGILLMFEILCLTIMPYSRLVRWQGVVATADTGELLFEARPVVTSIFPDDIRYQLEEFTTGTSTARILAAPYVNLAVGAMTDLQPISTADSYVSIAGPSYANFIAIPSCKDKYNKAIEWNLNYLIVHKTEQSLIQNCPEFSLIKQINPYYYMYRVTVDKSRK